MLGSHRARNATIPFFIVKLRGAVRQDDDAPSNLASQRIRLSLIALGSTNRRWDPCAAEVVIPVAFA